LPLALTAPEWTVPDKAIRCWGSVFVCEDASIPPDNSVAVFPLAMADKQGSDIGFYWVDGGEKVVVLNATIGGVPTSKTTTFNVRRPSTTLNAHTSAIEQRFTTIQFGHTGQGISEPEEIDGILFDASLDAGAAFAGELHWTQTVSFSWYGILMNGRPIRHVGSDKVDLGEIYSQGSIASDSPHRDVFFIPLIFFNDAAQLYQGRDDFDMYLMWQSNKAGSIPVPLKKVTWFWGFSASSDNGLDWQLNSLSNSNNPPATETTDQPTWNGTAQDVLPEYDD
jgi:hypothetical protein